MSLGTGPHGFNPFAFFSYDFQWVSSSGAGPGGGATLGDWKTAWAGGLRAQPSSLALPRAGGPGEMPFSFAPQV